MNPGWRPAKPEIEVATEILQRELPTEMQQRLLPIRSPGDARWVIERFQDGIRGSALDYTMVEWESSEEGSSSSCCADEDDVIKADEIGSFRDNALSWTARWERGLGESGWPFKPCLLLYRENESAKYFDQPVGLEPQEFQVLRRIAELSHRRPGMVPDYQIFMGIQIGTSYGHRASVISRIGRAIHNAALGMGAMAYAHDALCLVKKVRPWKVPNRGYRIERSELIRIV